MLEMHYDQMAALDLAVSGLGQATMPPLPLSPMLVQGATQAGKLEALKIASNAFNAAVARISRARNSDLWGQLPSGTRSGFETRIRRLIEFIQMWIQGQQQFNARGTVLTPTQVTSLINQLKAKAAEATALATEIEQTMFQVRQQAQTPPVRPPAEPSPDEMMPEEGMSTGAKIGLALAVLVAGGAVAYKLSQDEEEAEAMAGLGRVASKRRGLRRDGKLKPGCRYIRGGAIVCR